MAQTLSPAAQARIAPAARRGARPLVLIVIGAFWPGHDSAGPNQSVQSFAKGLGTDFDFRIVARDRPFRGGTAQVECGRWIDRGWASFCYCEVGARGAQGLGDILRQTRYDLLMLNGFFDREFTLPTLLLRRAGRVPRRPAIISTRGEFAGGALGLKAGRKAAWLAFVRSAGLTRDVWLHATGPREAEDVARGNPGARGVLVAPNMRILEPLSARPEARQPGAPLRLAFLGRIARVKNLDYALSVLAHVTVPVAFDIYGPIQEADHWAQCLALIAKLPSHITADHKGEIPNSAVASTLAEYDLLFLPTRGENFGHAIVDALAAGVPVLISDQTLFQDLSAQNAGWSLPLADPATFAGAIETLFQMAPSGRDALSRGARHLAEKTVNPADAIALNRMMLETALGGDKP